MVPIYALPDHEVVGRLLPGRFDALVPDDLAVERVRTAPGLIPAAIEPDQSVEGGGRVYWVDIGTHPYRDWQHLFTIERLAQAEMIETAFATSMAVLQVEDLIPNALTPSGFIFHTSRCGSTLMGKALARVPEHCVVNQGGPLQRGFWAALTDEWSRDLPDDASSVQMFRNLVFALTRPRLGTETTSFVKFISWNTLYLDFIAGAFPEVHSLFLFRDPLEVIASVIKETTAVLVAKDWPQASFLSAKTQDEVHKMDDVTYLAHCYDNYFKVILESSLANVKALDYHNLKSGTFGEVLKSGFAFAPDEQVIAEMCTQFRFHSKDDSDTSTFQSDRSVKQAAIAAEDRIRIERITAAQLGSLQAASKTLFGDEISGSRGAVY
ncbi:MAG: hypothetical protein COA84_06320 [Robiginitomaculum sp.]|nr:MAG: hypothetical protein COA84_06320 [Robiginitomaculum sp.]